MRSSRAFVAFVLVCSAAGISAQSKLPDADDVWVVVARAVGQPNNRAALELTLTSGVRMTVLAQDVHEYATIVVRSAMMKQASPSVPPALLFALQIRRITPVGQSDMDVTLASGGVVRVRASDVNDMRLTFLRTVLEQARSAEQPAQADAPPAGAAVQCDPTEKVDFDLGPWLRRSFIPQIRRSWFIPKSAASKQGRVRVRFLVHKDGRITDATVVEPSNVAEFNESSVSAVAAANVTPLPAGFPLPRVTLCVTFLFGATNETPTSTSTSTLTLPAREHLLVVGARAMRQPHSQAPLELTLRSGRRITVSAQDVHEPATILVRSAMAGQAYRAVEPSLLVVLHIRQLTPVSESDVKVSFFSGAVIRVRSSDVNDERLTFLRTVLAARSGVCVP